jgi:hypothetical protein
MRVLGPSEIAGSRLPCRPGSPTLERSISATMSVRPGARLPPENPGLDFDYDVTEHSPMT